MNKVENNPDTQSTSLAIDEYSARSISYELELLIEVYSELSGTFKRGTLFTKTDMSTQKTAAYGHKKISHVFVEKSLYKLRTIVRCEVKTSFVIGSFFLEENSRDRFQTNQYAALLTS